MRRYPAGLAMVLNSVALLLSGAAAGLAIWIVLPAPLPVLALVAVAASEWSLWVSVVGLLGAVLGLLGLVGGDGWGGGIAVGLGLVAAALSLMPPLSAHAVAAEHGVDLSLRAYVAPPAPDSVDRHPADVVYARPDNSPLRLDVYGSPAPRTGASRPAVVVVHGGAWSAGGRSTLPHWNRWLADQGFVVFDIEYRLGPQPNWQAATADVKCAVAWVQRHAREFGVDPRRVALLGRSAGGHLALLAAYATDAPGLASSCEEPTAPVAAVVAFYAPTDLAWGYEHPANPRVINGPGTLRRFLGATPGEQPERYRLASPIEHVGPSTPPTLLFHGGRDQYVRPEQTERLAARLRAAGVPHQAVIIPYAQHGFDYAFHGWGAQIVRPLLTRFLEAHL